MLQCHEQLSSKVCGVGRLRLLGPVCVPGAGQGGQLPAQLAACTGAGVCGGVHVCVHTHLSPLGDLGMGTALMLPCCPRGAALKAL